MLITSKTYLCIKNKIIIKRVFPWVFQVGVQKNQKLLKAGLYLMMCYIASQQVYVTVYCFYKILASYLAFPTLFWPVVLNQFYFIWSYIKIKNTTVMIYIVVVFWDFLMFEQIFLSPQMKWRMIMSNKHGIYQLPDELPNNLRLKSYGIRKYQEN